MNDKDKPNPPPHEALAYLLAQLSLAEARFGAEQTGDEFFTMESKDAARKEIRRIMKL